MENKVKIYVLDISNKHFDLSNLSLLEEKRRDNILVARNYLYKLRSMYAGLLLRHAMLNEGVVFDDSLNVEYSDNGKPFIRDGKNYSITHSGNVVMVAVADFEIGLDTEILQNKVYSHIANKVLSQRELMEYNKLKGKDMSEYFISHWVVKEAYLKFLGTGMKKFPSDVDVGCCLVNEHPYHLSAFNYKQYNYFTAVVAEEEFETETIYVKTLKTT